MASMIEGGDNRHRIPGCRMKIYCNPEWRDLFSSLFGEENIVDTDWGFCDNDYDMTTTTVTNKSYDEDDDEEVTKKMPKSIFDCLDEDEFDKCVPIDDANKVAKNPFVFIANRLTFLIKSGYPLIWDTSSIVTSGDKMFVAIDEDKTYPKVNFQGVGKITCEVNRDDDIQDEIDEYLEGTEYDNIYAFPSEEVVNGSKRLGVMFVVYKKSRHTHF